MSRADYLLRADVEGGLLIEGGCRGRVTYRGRITEKNATLIRLRIYLSRADVEGGLLIEGKNIQLLS
jgi:hypothetical protein